MDATLLVEILTEELPPNSLRKLGASFFDSLQRSLLEKAFIAPATNTTVRLFATPRRLAVQIENVFDVQPDRTIERKGPAVASGIDVSGNPTQALLGFMRSAGVTFDQLKRVNDGKTDYFVARTAKTGESIDLQLPQMVEKALKDLPVTKVMRWGSGEAQFVRPVHGLVMLHGSRVVPGSVLGLQSGNRTKGHRFMSKGDIVLANADEYETRMRDDGKVIADYLARRAQIEKLLKEKSKEQEADLGEYQSLLNEVTALVEHPSVYVGEFDKSFLDVPQECLILTMRQNQKYFPLFDAAGKLTGKFLIVSNMQVADARHIIGGNQRVVRPRLEDARFFFNQDRNQRLEERVPLLARVVYHNKLGSQLDRVSRVEYLARKISIQLKADESLATRAAKLCKADLLTGMVGEFPELQGIMGRYYALHDKEPAAVADAIEEHYRPRFAGDKLPEGPISCAVALADKLDAIAGMFSIGQQPTGDKDPFALRRAALGIVRILVENRLHLSLAKLAEAAFEPFKVRAAPELIQFVFDRFAGYLKDLGFSTLQIDAVLSMNPTSLSVVLDQLAAVKAFQLLPEAQSLAAANKRIVNILKQAESKGETPVSVELSALTDPAERALHEAIKAASGKAKPLYESGDYTGYLKSFATLKAPVDTFFDKVMVMVDDDKVRRNRLALLRDLREAMNRVADISRLAA